MAEIDVPVDLDVLLPALREAAGAELRSTGALALRAQGFSVRRDAHRPLLVAERDGARRLRVRSWPGMQRPQLKAGEALLAFGIVPVGWVTLVVTGEHRVIPPVVVVGVIGLLLMGLFIRAVLRQFQEHTHDDVAWLAAVLDRATKRLPPPEVGDDYR